MKLYKKRISLLNNRCLLSVCLFLLLLTLIVCITGYRDSKVYVILIGLISTLICIIAINCFSTFHKYGFQKDSIVLKYFFLTYKKIDYKSINFIVISDAIYNTSKYDSNYADYPMYHVIKNHSGKRERIQYPYISIVLSKKVIDSINKELNSRQLLLLDTKNVLGLGICWFDALDKLLCHTMVDVYIFANVYYRYKSSFDLLEKKHMGRFCVLTPKAE